MTDPMKNKVVADYYAWSLPDFQNEYIELARLELTRAQFEAAIPKVLATERVHPRVTRVLRRGNFLDESGDIVSPAIPAVFGKLPTGDRDATRLDLANWIASPENPLTARVFVNRL